LANFPDLSKVNLFYIFVRLNKVILHPSIWIANFIMNEK
jgi:hypothetical protein